jgi:hypothetical protein
MATVDIGYRTTKLTGLTVNGVRFDMRAASVNTQVVTVEGTPPEDGPWELTLLHDGPDPEEGEHDFVGTGPTGTWVARGRVVSTDSVSIGADRFRRTLVQRP